MYNGIFKQLEEVYNRTLHVTVRNYEEMYIYKVYNIP